MFSGEYIIIIIIILVKSVCRGPFLVAEYGVFILGREVLDVLLQYVEMCLIVWVGR